MVAEGSVGQKDMCYTAEVAYCQVASTGAQSSSSNWSKMMGQEEVRDKR